MNTREKALEALKQKEIQDKIDRLERLEEQFLDLKEKFPDLTINKEELCFELAGYKFNAYPTGTEYPSGKISYSLDPHLRMGHWVYDMASLGRFILDMEKLYGNKTSPSEPKLWKYIKPFIAHWLKN